MASKVSPDVVQLEIELANGADEADSEPLNGLTESDVKSSEIESKSADVGIADLVTAMAEMRRELDKAKQEIRSLKMNTAADFPADAQIKPLPTVGNDSVPLTKGTDTASMVAGNNTADDAIEMKINRPSTEEIVAAQNVTLSMNQNVYNCYLLCKYHPNRRIWDKLEPSKRRVFTFFVYFVTILQYVCLAGLIYLTIKGGDMQRFNSWHPTKFIWKEFVAIPFVIGGILFTLQENYAAVTDIFLLSEVLGFNYIPPNMAAQIELDYLKFWCEKRLNTYGSFAYFMCLAWFAQPGDIHDYIEIIFNVLAYAFIFEFDEWAYGMIEHALILETNNLFSGKDMFEIKGNLSALVEKYNKGARRSRSSRGFNPRIYFMLFGSLFVILIFISPRIALICVAPYILRHMFLAVIKTCRKSTNEDGETNFHLTLFGF